MSARSQAAYAKIAGTRAMLQRLADGLGLLAGGEAVTRTAAKVQAQVLKVAKSQLGRHRLSGNAEVETVVDVSGGLVTLHGMPAANGKQWSGSSYVGLKSWWSFRGQRMPQFILQFAAETFAAEVIALITGSGAREVIGALVAADAEALVAGVAVRQQNRAVAKERRRLAAKAKREAKRRGI